MRFTNIFNNVIKLWPSEIDFSDSKYFIAEDGFSSEKLNSIWEEVELKIETKNEWEKLMVWTIYCVVHSLAKTKFRNNIFTIHRSEIEPNIAKDKYIEHLKILKYVVRI
jgi:hypothetical protein